MNAPELRTHEVQSTLDAQPRRYYIYTPRGYDASSTEEWPLLLFLHGDGERGNGQNELPFVLKHGPLFEAWIQQQDLPFLIVSPQLPMFGRDKRGIAHLQNRSLTTVPVRGRLAPPREAPTGSSRPIKRVLGVREENHLAPLLPEGWDCVEQDVLNVLQDACHHYRVDRRRRYLTGLSYGGFGTWHMAASHPQLFAAIAPVCGWLHPKYAPAIAAVQTPTWLFAGGRDSVITIDNFYLGIEALRQAGHKQVRFTVHEDMEHDVWRRVYESSDLYHWLLSHEQPT